MTMTLIYNYNRIDYDDEPDVDYNRIDYDNESDVVLDSCELAIIPEEEQATNLHIRLANAGRTLVNRPNIGQPTEYINRPNIGQPTVHWSTD
jgi:hypothetical protein